MDTLDTPSILQCLKPNETNSRCEKNAIKFIISIAILHIKNPNKTLDFKYQPKQAHTPHVQYFWSYHTILIQPPYLAHY